MLQLRRTVQNPIARLACAALLAWNTAGLPVIAAEPTPSRLTVTGQGRIAIPATIAQVSLGVEIRARTAEDAQAQAAAASEAIVSYLKSQNVDQLQTQGIQLAPVYTNDDGRSRISEYMASNIVSFRVETEAVGEIIDEPSAEGATRISGLSFVGSDQEIATARSAALRAATLDAREQADVVLDTLGLAARSIGQIYIGYSTPMPTTSIRNEAAAYGDFMSRSAVEGGEQMIEASVTLEILY
ncbi:MAG: SIMPL domain-containing protein [Coleofasciculaceae cyanobacterium RL_1_1]|nr:SIMPL domain-containing protein [Coleofasciculaceae cyanobacterium RL_1_1]